MPHGWKKGATRIIIISLFLLLCWNKRWYTSFDDTPWPIVSEIQNTRTHKTSAPNESGLEQQKGTKNPEYPEFMAFAKVFILSI